MQQSITTSSHQFYTCLSYYRTTNSRIKKICIYLQICERKGVSLQKTCLFFYFATQHSQKYPEYKSVCGSPSIQHKKIVHTSKSPTPIPHLRASAFVGLNQNGSYPDHLKLGRELCSEGNLGIQLSQGISHSGLEKNTLLRGCQSVKKILKGKIHKPNMPQFGNTSKLSIFSVCLHFKQKSFPKFS